MKTGGTRSCKTKLHKKCKRCFISKNRCLKWKLEVRGNAPATRPRRAHKTIGPRQGHSGMSTFKHVIFCRRKNKTFLLTKRALKFLLIKTLSTGGSQRQKIQCGEWRNDVCKSCGRVKIIGLSCSIRALNDLIIGKRMMMICGELWVKICQLEVYKGQTKNVKLERKYDIFSGRSEGDRLQVKM